MFMYIEIFRKGDESTLLGNIFKVFEEDKIPPVPEDPRLARIEITDKTPDEITEMIKAGLGAFTLSGVENGSGVRNLVTRDRDLSVTFAEVEKNMAQDVEPAKVEGEKTFLERDLPGKPKGSLFVQAPGDRVYRCATDPGMWFEPDAMEKVSKPEKALPGNFEASLVQISEASK